MEYKFYRQEGDGYLLRSPSGLMYFSIIVFGLLAIGGLAMFFADGKVGGLIWALVCILFCGFAWYRYKARKIYFLPALQQVQVRIGDKVKKQYTFGQFMNFQKTRVRTNGITSQWHVSMYFDENGKNKNILLGMSFRQKTVDHIITETEAVMQVGQQYRNSSSFSTFA
jgi:hypothetical protein